MTPQFKKWLADDEAEQNEVATSTGDVASFARHVLPTPVRRQWLGPWGKEDPFFRKKRNKKNESAEPVTKTQPPPPAHNPKVKVHLPPARKKPSMRCPLCNSPARGLTLLHYKNKFGKRMCEKCAISRITSA